MFHVEQGRTPSQALPRQIPPFVTYGDIFPGAGEVFPQRESQAVTFVAKVLGTTRKLSGVLLALPLGELSPQVTERAHAVSSVTNVSKATRNFPATTKSRPLGQDGRDDFRFVTPKS